MPQTDLDARPQRQLAGQSVVPQDFNPRLQATDTPTLAAGLAPLADRDLSAAVTADAVSQLAPLFCSLEAPGVRMAIRAATNAQPEEVSASFTVLVSDLFTASTVGRSTNQSSPTPI